MAVVIISLLSFSAFATDSTTLDFRIKQLQELVDVGPNGGNAEIIDYNVKKFTYKKHVKELLKTIKGNDCKYVPFIGIRELFNVYSSLSIFSNSKQAHDLLEKISIVRGLKGALGYYWSADGGDAENCSTEQVELYFSNGKALIIYFDATT